jgi:sec-independent protein translocase protein TatA
MLNNIGPMGFIIIAVVVLVLFGRGKISGMMGEVGKGITAFKKGMDDGRREIEDATTVTRDAVPPAGSQTVTSTTVNPDGSTVTTISPERDRA